MEKSKDFQLAEFRSKMVDALKSDNPENVAKVFEDLVKGVENKVIADIQAVKGSNDIAILASRGARILTDEEETFYKAIQKSAKTGNIEKAFDGIENTYPESVVEAVSEGIRESFPLLAEIDFQSSKTVTKMILNASGVQLAQWGGFGSAISKELEGAFRVIDVTAKKLAALMPVSKDIIQAGPVWIDSFVRKCLVEAVGQAMCYAIVKGNGKVEPIGMMMDCSKGAAVVDGVYPAKTKKKISSLDADVLGDLYASVSKDDNGRSRKVNGAIIVCNPTDYYRYIFPAITVRNAEGEYITRTALPVKFIEEASMPEGEACFGIGKDYFLGIVFGGETGAIEFSDEAKFVEDLRMYKTKILADGRPKNSSSFVPLDLSGLVKASA